jgi:hypothetical protein
MDVIAAYRDVGSYRSAAQICGTTHKTVKRIIEAPEAGRAPGRKSRGRNFDQFMGLGGGAGGEDGGPDFGEAVVAAGPGRRLCRVGPEFRRLVAQVKAEWRQGHHRGRRPGVWSPAETLIIDWGVEAGLHVFCAVLAWSRFRFVRFAADEKAATTFGLLAEWFRVAAW